MRLQGKTVVITGGNSGVGASAAKLFAKEGASVVISARRAEALRAVAEEIEAAGGTVLAVPTDISKKEECHTLMEQAVETFGEIHVLINNAGVLDSGLRAIHQYSDEDLSRVIAINQIGTMQCIRAVLPHMPKGGSIVNMASVAGHNGGGGAAYVSTKAAIIGLTKHTALVQAPHGIRCNALCPGTILTPMTAEMKPEELDVSTLLPMQKHNNLELPPCTPEDVAKLLLFLASDDSKPLTGQVLVCDYGVSL